jgi:hypothetical protein
LIEIAQNPSHAALQQGVEASFPKSMERNMSMHEPDFWTNCAEAMEMSIEGDRLIVREIADALHGLLRRAVRSVEGLLHGPRHLPPN